MSVILSKIKDQTGEAYPRELRLGISVEPIDK
jgi:hypothetical protein